MHTSERLSRFAAKRVFGHSMIMSGLLLVSAAEVAAEPKQATARQAAPTVQQMSLMPLAFTKNEGQWDEHALYQAKGQGVLMWFTEEGVLYHMTRRVEEDREWSLTERSDEMPTQQPAAGMVEHRVVKATLVGGNPSPEVVPENEMEYKCNWFIGNDPEKWHTDVPNYSSLIYRGVYPGIDVRYRGNGTQIEHDFIISPGADPSLIELRYDGAQSVTMSRNGDLVIVTDLGELIERIPKTYQERNGHLEPVSCCYEITGGNTVRFLLDEGHDTELALVIDPTLVYSTYLGGSADERANAIDIDATGSSYVTGFSMSTDFPMSNAYDPSFGGSDPVVFVAKFSADGSSLVYSTYLGGSAGSLYEVGLAIRVNGNGEAYVTGNTGSSDFPMQNAYDNTYGGSGDIFVTKFSSTGSSLLYSTFLGTLGPESGRGIAIDGAGYAYVVGWTTSFSFPTKAAYDASINGGSDAVVIKLGFDGDTLCFSTFLGGSLDDQARAIAVTASGSAFVTGFTPSVTFPTANPIDGSHNGDLDAFITQFDASGSSLVYSTFLGGSTTDWGYGIDIDAAGNAYVVGTTGSSDFPLVAPFDGTFDGGGGFVAKVNSTGSALDYSTFLGGECLAVAADELGNAFVTGWVLAEDFPTVDPFDATHNGGHDAFFSKFNPAGSALTYSTFIGGGDPDDGFGIATNIAGDAAIVGATSSSDFATVAPYDASLNVKDAFVCRVTFTSPPGTRVTSLGDSGPGTIRQAIIDANASGNIDTIYFDVAGTITLNSPLPAITGPVIIDGLSAPGASVQNSTVVVNFTNVATNPGFALQSDSIDVLGLTFQNCPEEAIVVDPLAQHCTIRYSNFTTEVMDGIFIDLNGNGITPNDPGDLDNGANDLLNYPEFDTVAEVVSDEFRFAGVAPPKSFIDLYLAGIYPNDDTIPHPLGHGPAYQFLGSDTADAITGAWSIYADGVLLSWKYVTALTTDTLGNTSEFSLNQPVLADTLSIIAYSPVDLILITPDGMDSIGIAEDRTIYNTIGTNASYDTLTDFGPGPNGVVGEADDAIRIALPQFGEWLLKVIPEPWANPDDSYFLGVRDPGGDLTGVRDPGGDIRGNVLITGLGTNSRATVHDTLVANDVPPQGSFAQCLILVAPQRRGDMNDDKFFNIVDVVSLVNIAFRNATLPLIPEVADPNGDGISTNILDIVTEIEHVFRAKGQPCP